MHNSVCWQVGSARGCIAHIMQEMSFGCVMHAANRQMGSNQAQCQPQYQLQKQNDRGREEMSKLMKGHLWKTHQ